MTTTNTGKAEVAQLVIGTGIAFGYIAIGSGGTGDFDPTDTALNTEEDRQAASVSTITTTVAGDTAKFVATFNFTGNKAIKESGVFNAGTNGDMLCAKRFDVMNFQNGDSLEVTYKFVVS